MFDVDEHWKVSINPHGETIENQPGRSVFVEFNGWPAGVFGAFSGEWLAANWRTRTPSWQP